MRLWLLWVGLFIIGTAGSAFPQAPGDIQLPAPQVEGGMPLMEALAARHTSRDFATTELPTQVMADLLWAAAGINRPESGKRTAPSARNWQEVSVYVVTAKGAYLYDAEANMLRAVAEGDLRDVTGRQSFVGTAPVNLVFVADITKMEGAGPDAIDIYAGADTGFISQNVYLFCASEGLATVVRGSVDREAVAKALGLGEQHRVVLAQTVGYPAEE